MVRGAVTIGNESAVAFPLDASYSGTIATRPFNGSTQSLNPPIFSWSAKVSFLAEESGSLVVNPFFPEYQLVISTNVDLSGALINKRVISNMENRFDPFTNANGSINSNVIYWAAARVETNGTTNGWTLTNSFRVSAAATNWSRGLLADETYLAAPQHPYLLFTPTNRAAAYQFFQTNDTYVWTLHLIHLDQFTNHATSGNTWPTNTQGWSTNGNWAIVPAGFAYPTNVNVNFTALYQALMHYAMTNDPNLRVLLVNQYSNCVNWLLGVHYVFNDIGSGDGPLVFNILTRGFDWLYNDLDATTRANAILAGERYCKWTMRSISWGGASWADGYDTNYVLGRMQQMWFALSEQGTSHNNIQFALASEAGLAFYQHGTNARAMFDAGLNWLIARGNFTGGFAAINQGRGYSTVGNGVMIESMISFDRVFPECQLYRIPMLQGFAAWMFDVIPPGWREFHGASGDGGGAGTLFTAMSLPSFGQLLALFSRNGSVVRAYTNSLVFYNPAGIGSPIMQPHLHSLWPPVATVTNSMDSVYLEDGWVVSASKALNAADVFTNGVGFNLVARPRGSEGGHSTYCDGDVELWAYGAKVTDSGSINLDGWGYGHEAHNNPAIAGYGPKFVPQYGASPVLPYYARIIAVTNQPTWSYAAADMTAGFTNAKTVAWIPTNAYVTKSHRHVLFPQRKYWIIYDDLASSAPTSYQFKWHILEPGLRGLTSTSFVYSATNFAGQRVSNHVFFASSGQTVSNMTGFAVQTNPVTATFASDAGAATRHTNVLWFANATTATNWHFMVAIVPQGPTNSAPVFMRIDDNTISVAYDGVTETNTFGTNYVGAYTYRVETIGESSGVGSEPGGIRRARAGRVQAVKVIN